MPPKRKRAATNPTAVQPSIEPSAVAGKKAEDESPQKAGPTQEAATEPTSSSRRGKTAGNGKNEDRSDVANGDDSTPSSGNSLHVEKAPIENAVGGASGTKEIEKPPKAGIVDPVGFHTNPPPKDRIVRVYADGVFDLFHLGHMRQLEQAKTAFPSTHLTVGVTGDADTHNRKGLTVLSAAERAETVRHCRWVDAVIPDCPWVVTAEFLEEHKIDYVAHDDMPYGAAEGDDIYRPIKEQGKFLVTQRTEGVSTTGIITKIVRDYNNYVGRQLKRGASRKELNVSWLKKNELDLKRNVSDLREAIRTNWTTTGTELGKELKSFWDRSRPASPAPSLRRSASGKGQSSTAGRDGSNDLEKSPPVPAFAHLGHLEIPRSPNGSGMEPSRSSSDFATGYSMGLVGGIRSWMMKSRRTLMSDSGAPSPEGSEESDESGSNGMKVESPEDEEGRQARKRVRRD